MWLVSPSRLPVDAKIQLKVTPGLRSYAGPLLGVERRTVVSFDTFPEFRFLGVRCLNGTTSTLISATTPQGNATCLQSVRHGLARLFRAGDRSGNQGAPGADVRICSMAVPTMTPGRTSIRAATWDRRTNAARNTRCELPEHLRAFQPYSIVSLQGVRDEFGRPLAGRPAHGVSHRPPPAAPQGHSPGRRAREERSDLHAAVCHQSDRHRHSLPQAHRRGQRDRTSTSISPSIAPGTSRTPHPPGSAICWKVIPASSRDTSSRTPPR